MAKEFKNKLISEIQMSKTISNIADSSIVSSNTDSFCIERTRDKGSYCTSCGGYNTVHVYKCGEKNTIKSICTKCGKVFIDHTNQYEEMKTKFEGLKCPACGNEDILLFRKNGYENGIQRYRCNKCGKTFKKECDIKAIKTDRDNKIKEANKIKFEGLKCPTCGNEDINSFYMSGKYKDGSQRYKCKKCGRLFKKKEDDYKTCLWKVEIEGLKCPECGNEDINSFNKAGKDKYGIQKYRCEKCGRSFKKEDDYKIPNFGRIEVEGLKCPECGNENLKFFQKAGKDKDGSQRYHCTICKKYFKKEDDYKIPNFGRIEVEGLKCPECGNDDVKYIWKNGIYKDGRQKYKCAKCGKQFTGGDTKHRKKEVVEGIECPRCKSKNIVEYGNVDGTLRFRCRTCNDIFLDPREYQIFNKDHMICRKCGNDDPNMFSSAGFYINAKNQKQQRYRCKKCGFLLVEGSKGRPRYNKSDIENTDEIVQNEGRNNIRKRSYKCGKYFKKEGDNKKNIINESRDLIYDAMSCTNKKEIKQYIEVLKKYRSALKSTIKLLKEKL